MISSKLVLRALAIGMVLSLVLVTACGKNNVKTTEETVAPESGVNESVAESSKQETFFKLSLAQWSLHKKIESGEMNPIDFAEKASELGFSGIEYVNTLYEKELKKGEDAEKSMEQLLQVLLEKSKQFNVDNVLIMVDSEGDMADINDEKRNESVENHKKWVDAAAYLGCHSIRVNAHGEGTEEEVADAAVKGLSALSEYAATKGINVLVENHGGYTSNGKWLSSVMKRINLPNCGTLPDFGNFCMNEDYGSINAEECEDVYDIYIGVAELLPYAKGVSAKSYDFDEAGNQPMIDYNKMMQIVKDGGYSGYIGVEYEGDNLEEIEGIKATKDLILRAASSLK